MDDTSLYPNDGAFFSNTIPQDQAEAADSQQKQVQDLAPVLKESIDNLSARIEFYNSLDSIDDAAVTDPELFMHTIAAYKIVKTCLMQEKSRLEVLYADHVSS